MWDSPILENHGEIEPNVSPLFITPRRCSTIDLHSRRYLFVVHVSAIRFGATAEGGGEGVSKYNLHGQLDSCTIHLMSERHVHANIQNEIAKHARVVGVVGQT